MSWDVFLMKGTLPPGASGVWEITDDVPLGARSEVAAALAETFPGWAPWDGDWRCPEFAGAAVDTYLGWRERAVRDSPAE
jgi:hypothetical protein